MNIGKEIIRIGTVDSTNTYAMELAEKGAAHGTVVLAEHQTKGKGRMGRTWVSPPGGNIYMSVILRPTMKLKDGTLLTIMAGVACCRALREITGLPVGIKWPNDLMISGRKLGGILTEIKANAGNIVVAIMGVGLNVNAPIEHLPPDVRETATSIRQETDKEQSKDVFIAGLLNEIDHWAAILDKEGRGPILDEWRRLAATLDKSVQVTLGSETLTGVAEDVDEQGMLILRLPSGILKRISAGDVTMLR